nr:orotate phosphoribosyltransferase [Gemmatimonadales bacterium]
AVESAGGRVLGVLAVVERGRGALQGEATEVIALADAGELGVG